MRESTPLEPVSDMATAFQSQAQELLKSHVDGYTRRDGTFVAPHETAQAAAKDKPAAGSGRAAGEEDGAPAMLRNAFLNVADAEKLGGAKGKRATEDYGRLVSLQDEFEDAAPGSDAEKAVTAKIKEIALKYPPQPAGGKKGGMLAKALEAGRAMLKAHVDQFTRKDGTTVKAHETKVQAAGPGAPGKGKMFHAKMAGQHLHASLKTTDPAARKLHETAATAHAAASKTPKNADLSAVAHAATAAAPAHDGTAFTGADVAAQKQAQTPAMSESQLQGAAAQLCNDEESTDRELESFMVEELDVTPEQAAKLVAVRGDFLKMSPGEQTPEGLADLLAQKGAPGKGEKAPAAPAAKPAAKAQPSPAGKATGATPKQLEMMESSLANDEESTDDELVEHFVAEGVPEAVAKQAVGHRDAFLSNATPESGMLGKLMQKDASGKGGEPDAGDVPREAQQPGAGKSAPSGESNPGKGGDSPAGEGAAAAAAPPQADANEAGWDQLPDDENPKHALSGLGSKALGALATMKPDHAKAHAHAALASRGMDSDGGWKGFDDAKAHHAGSMPDGFQPHPEVSEHLQTVKGKVLQAAAGGHLDLQKRARATLAGRGHDTQGSFVGFDKAKELHGGAKKGGAQGELFKAQRPDTRTMLFVAAGDADLLARRMDDAKATARRIGAQGEAA